MWVALGAALLRRERGGGSSRALNNSVGVYYSTQGKWGGLSTLHSPYSTTLVPRTREWSYSLRLAPERGAVICLLRFQSPLNANFCLVCVCVFWQVLRHSAELRAFLESEAGFATSPVLREQEGSLLQSAARLPQQLMGNQPTVVTPAETSQPAKASRDLFRWAKELKQVKEPVPRHG